MFLRIRNLALRGFILAAISAFLTLTVAAQDKLVSLPEAPNDGQPQCATIVSQGELPKIKNGARIVYTFNVEMTDASMTDLWIGEIDGGGRSQVYSLSMGTHVVKFARARASYPPVELALTLGYRCQGTGVEGPTQSILLNSAFQVQFSKMVVKPLTLTWRDGSEGYKVTYVLWVRARGEIKCVAFGTGDTQWIQTMKNGSWVRMVVKYENEFVSSLDIQCYSDTFSWAEKITVLLPWPQ